MAWYALVCILTLLLTADFRTSRTLNNQKTYCNQNWQRVQQSTATNRQHKSLAVVACTGPGSEEVTGLLLCRWKYSTEHKEDRVHIILRTAAGCWHFRGLVLHAVTFMSLSALIRCSTPEWLMVIKPVWVQWVWNLFLQIQSQSPTPRAHAICSC